MKTTLFPCIGAFFIGATLMAGCFTTSAFAQNATEQKHSYPGFDTLPQHRHHQLERKCTELAPGIFAFVGYSSSNFGVITTKNGYILVDTGDDLNRAAEALKQIKELTPGKLQAIILTHGHPDHRGGFMVFLEGRKDVPIWGHVDFGAEQKTGKGLEKIFGERFGKQFGIGIPDAQFTPNFMTPRFPDGKPATGPLAVPNKPFTEEKTVLTIDGVTLEAHMIPGESADHIAIWLPKQQVLFAGDNVYGCFPNLYPIRGGAYRDVERWANAVRRLMEFKPNAVMFGHNDVPAKDEILPLLENYASAMEYVYEETIKGMNEGKTADELAVSVRLPEELRSKPYLGEFYGAVGWAVREIFAAKIGWFDGNPTNLVPLTPLEKAEHMAKLAGGKDKLARLAQTALQDGDYRWAALLADHLLQLGKTTEGKRIKADALDGISRDILPISGKNYLQRSAVDLRK